MGGMLLQAVRNINQVKGVYWKQKKGDSSPE